MIEREIPFECGRDKLVIKKAFEYSLFRERVRMQADADMEGTHRIAFTWT